MLNHGIATSRDVSRITITEAFLTPLLIFSLLLFPGSSPISFSYPVNIGENCLLPRMSFFTHYFINEIFEAGFFKSVVILHCETAAEIPAVISESVSLLSNDISIPTL